MSNQIKTALSQAISREEKELGQWEDLMMDEAAEFSRNNLAKLRKELDALEA
jgi:hypothetical protein